MTSFASLEPIQHTLVLVLFLSLLLTYTHILSITIIRTKRFYVGLLALLNILAYYLMISILTTYLYELKLGGQLSSRWTYFANLPTLAYGLIIIAGYFLALYLLYIERNYQKNIITRSSIKEALDNLPTGLSLANEDGDIILSNWQIDRLSHKLIGESFRNSNRFWDALINGRLKEGNIGWDKSSNPIIRDIDGRTWSFRQRKLKLEGQEIIEITGTDITDLDNLRNKLEDDNAKLAEMGLRLKKYMEDVMEVKAKEERFATKMRIHDEMGYALLATRQYIKKENWGLDIKTDAKEILDLWKYNIGILLGVNEAKKTTALDSFVSAAKSIGIEIKVNGKLPETNKEANLILMIAGECLTNSVRHARATELYLDIEEEENYYRVAYSNNGLEPKEKVVEGGGLSGIRKNIEELGGEMEVSHRPKFILRVDIPKEGGLAYV